MPVAKLTSKGQVTIPREVREELNLHAGDRLLFSQRSDGEWAVMALTGSIKEMRGMLMKPERPVTLEDMKAAVAKGASRRFRRSSP